MKQTACFLGLLASAAIAQPFAGHGHHHHHARHAHADDAPQKRAVQTKWETDWVYVTVTELIDDTTTQFIMPSTSLPIPTTTTSSSSAIASSTDGGQFLETTPSNMIAIPAPTLTSPALVETSTVAVPTTPTSVYVPPVQPTTLSTISTTPPAPTTSTSAAAAASSSTASSGSTGGSTDQSHTGDLTYYTLGLGACGWDDSGKDLTENVVALAVGMMGSQSNGNPYCGKTITVSRGGVSAQATIRDKCMGCEGASIDASEMLFMKLFGGSLDAGRGEVTWSFNE